MPGPYLNQGIFRTRVTETVPTLDEELGVWRYEAGKIYRFVKTGSLIPRFEAVKYDATVTTAALIGNQVIQTSGASDVMAGIAEISMAALSFGWITVWGPATARVDAGGLAGSALGASANTGVLSIRNISHFGTQAVALANGLSFGSAVFIRA